MFFRMMPRPGTRTTRLCLATLVAATASAVALPSAVAAPGTDSSGTTSSGFHRAPSKGRIDTDATARMSDPDARVSVIVQLSGDPVAVAQAKAGGDLSSTKVNQIQSALSTEQSPVAGFVRSHGGHVVSQMRSAYNGLHVQIASKDIDRLADLPGVEAVHPVPSRTAANSSTSSRSAAASGSSLGIPQLWQRTGLTGRRIRVAVIDTGLDYTHADFAGPGTPAAYDAARARSAATPSASLVGPRAPRVKGGRDFAGDSYDSSGTGSALVPRPDSNPLDCNGHGTHVAGTLAGSGVTTAGRTYTGPYNASARSFLVSPGIAPQVDLYPLKVFGCSGTSDLTTEAIDWAVAHRMNVINISLGSVHGRPGDPDAVAASNAVAAGAVVVSAAGNQGQNPYLTGAPAAGRGVISVAAVNNQASLPGYRSYASFSSSGPASGDSSLPTGVAAPGIAISSAALGTGRAAVAMSGTSSASPQVAGVAALAVQAHRGWSASQIGAALSSTASSSRVVGYDPVLGGGLVDPARALATSSFAEGDHYRVASGTLTTGTLSFGLVESRSTIQRTRPLVLVNKGSRPITYTVAARASAGSRPATVSLSTRRVTLRPHSSARIMVTLRAPASRVGSSLDNRTGFHQISGDVVLSAGRSTQILRVPYLMVPRAQTNASAVLRTTRPGVRTAHTAAIARGVRPGTTNLTVTNSRGAMAARSAVFTWGLSDRRRDPTITGGSGYDLRAAGVQTRTVGGQKLLVFAINTWDRWSSASANEYDVAVDANGDGVPDRIVFATDSGVIRRGEPDGVTEVFIQDIRTGAVTSSGYLALAPTDSSTIELPVTASALGLRSSSGSFSYTVAGYGVDSGEDTFGSQWARYNPWQRAIGDGAGLTVAVNRSARASLATTAAEISRQKPRGVMVVTPDNPSGSGQAALLSIH